MRNPSQLTIGVIGYYGFGNAGDEVILDNLRQFLAPHRVVVLPAGLLNSAATVRRLNAFDFLILGGGGLYRSAPPSPFGEFAEWGSRLRTSIGVLGLGITFLPPHYAAATERLVEQSTFFVVRDEESRRLLDHPKVRVAPDLTFYRPLEVERQDRTEEGPVCGVNLRPAHAGVEEWVQAVNALPYRKRAMPFSFHPALGDRETLLAIDPDCPERFCVADYGQIDFLIGTAFHSIVFAIQLGIPVVAVNYDPKVERLMREVGLSEYMLQWDEASELEACCERLLVNREAVRQRMQRYTREATERLQRELREPRKIIEETEPARGVGVVEQPKVSVIVNWQEEDADDLKRTLSACLEQTHESLEVIVAGRQGRSVDVRGRAGGDAPGNSVIWVEPEDAVGWRLAGLEAATGDYITCVEAGVSYTADALALMVDALQNDAGIDLVSACFFLTSDGTIERKMRLDSGPGSSTPRLLGPCWLVRRATAGRFLGEMQGRWQRTVLPSGFRSVYLEAALGYRPASERESNLYRSLLAYARGDVPQGQALLARSVAAGDSRGIEATAEELPELLVAVARNAPAMPDAEAFASFVFANLPPAASQLRGLQRRAQANIAFNQFFENFRAGNWRGVLRSAWRGAWRDPRWLRNRGVWSMVLQAAVASIGGRS